MLEFIVITGKQKKIPHDHGNNIKSMGTNVRNEILQSRIFLIWFIKYYFWQSDITLFLMLAH